MELENPDGTYFSLWSDLDKLADEMKKHSINDHKRINKLLRDARRMEKFNMYIDKPLKLCGIKDYFKIIGSYLPYLDLFIKYKNKSIESYSDKFKSKKLKEILLDFMQHIENYPLILLLLIFSYMDLKNADYPVGGSYKLSETIEKEAIKLGVKINYNTKALKIITENNKAIGVSISDNKCLYSDYVVSCSDGYNTIFKLLEGKYTTKKILKQYNKLPRFLSYMQVSFGINKDLSDTMQFILYKLPKSIEVGENIIDQLRIRHYSFNEGFAPIGKTSLVVTFKADYEYWNDLYENDRELYDLEKVKVADSILDVLEERYKNIKEFVEVIDVATPKTFQAKTLNDKGSAEGWYTNCNTFDEKFKYKIKGLKNFYMEGHWTNINGGITFAALSGRDVAQLLCHEEKVEFSSN
jgi:phytoene dehydrogenase-like protein